MDLIEQRLGDTLTFLGSFVSLVLMQLVEKQIEHKFVTGQKYSAYCTRYTA